MEQDKKKSSSPPKLEKHRRQTSQTSKSKTKRNSISGIKITVGSYK
ncbi:hypothetical protein [Ruminococcus flavefaciens]|nr:hypothetical protein [Ruminococcus flavefaciens]